MGKDIDERIVEMRFNNRQFESGVQQTTKSLENLKQSLNLKESAKNLKDLEAAGNNFTLDGIGRAVDNISSKFNALGVVGFTVLQNLTNSALNFSKNIIKQLTVAPLADGYKEYEMTLNAVQTTMAATGKTAEQVEEQLKRLDKYADDTVYSSADMFNNLPKFTNAGVDLEKATTAMIGIANATALAGGDASKASIAFYNLGQSIGTGYLTRMDYNSINNAGIATMEWKKQMVEAAVAQGKLKKINEDSYQAGKKNFTLQSLFIDGLQEQWASADVLMKVFGDYGNTETEIGKKAQASAQDIKHFTMLMDSLKATAGTGWKDTWQIMFGGLDEAKKLWTGISNAVGGFITKTATARNEMLQLWKDLGGRTAILNSFKNTFAGIGQVITPIKEAFREIFPATTGIQLKDISVKLLTLTKKFQVSAETADKIKRTFKGLFSIFDVGKKLLSGVFKVFSKASGAVNPIIDGILSLTAAFGDWLSSIDAVLTESGALTSAFKVIGDVIGAVTPGVSKGVSGIMDAISGLLNFNISGKLSSEFKPLEKLGAIFGTIGEWAKKLGSFLSPAIGKIKEFFGSLDFSTIAGAANTGVFIAIGASISKFVKSLSGIGKSVVDVLDGVRGCLEAYQSQIKSGVILKIAISVGILAAALLVLSSIPKDKIASSLTAITVLFAELIGAMSAFQKVVSAKNMKGLTKVAFMMILLAIAVTILASAMAKLAGCDWPGIFKGLIGVAALMAMLVGAAKLMDKVSGKVMRGAVGFIAFGAAILILAAAVEKLSKIDFLSLLKGLGAIAVLMAEIILFTKLMGNPGKLIGAATGMLIMGGALLMLSASVSILGKMDINQLAQGLIALVVGITAIGVCMKLFMSADMIGAAAALLVISVALLAMGAALKIMGSMSGEQIAMAVMVLAGAMITLVATINLLNGALPGAAALLVISASLVVLAVAMGMLGALSIETIIKSLGTLAVTLALLGGAAALLSPLIGPMLGMGAALIVLGIGLAAIGAAAIVLGIGLGSLGAAGFKGIGVLAALTAAAVPLSLVSPVLIALGAALAVFGVGVVAVGAGLLLLSTGLSTITALGQAGIDTLTRLSATAVSMSLLAAPIAVAGAALIAFGAGCAVAGVGMIAGGAGLLAVAAGLSVLSKVKIEKIQGINTVSKDLLKASVKLLIASPGLLAGGAALLVFGAGAAATGAGLKSIGSGLAETVKGVNEVPSQVKDSAKTICSSLDEMCKTAVKSIKAHRSEFVGSGKYLIDGLTLGMKSQKMSASEAGAAVARGIIGAINYTAGVASPSKEMMKTGKFMDMGLAIGLKKYAGLASNAATSLAEDTLTPVRDFTSDLNTEAMSVQDALKGVSFGNMSVAPVLHTEETVIMNHTFDTLHVEGVNDKGEFVAAADYAVEDILTTLMRRQNRI